MNRLENEKSPYLQQHKNNPVDWYPWGDEAFNQAKAKNKPIFLSIGYATCHWCHVMEKESFEDAQIAAMMNETFINIKVDREERPDIDHIYMTVCQMITGRGGWPLTIFMTPDKKPFFAGTYFPKEARGNMIGMRQLINRTKEIWAANYKDVLASADDITEDVILHTNGQIAQMGVSEMLFEKVKDSLSSNYDREFGGFGSRPKFPSPHNIIFLLNFHKYYRDSGSIQMAEHTLKQMRAGGIYDHIGKGFHRYSTDNEWLVPHFEKMIYDQATLMNAYTEAFKLTHNAFYKDTALEIWEYLKNEMNNGAGGIYSAEDADSEGEEGKYYLWTIGEIRENLIGFVDIFCDYFNIKEQGNYNDEISHSLNGKNILNYKKNSAEICSKYNLEEDELNEIIKNCSMKLYQIRNKRVKPLLDDKILTDWNAMMISSIANAAKTFQDEEMLDFAKLSIDFIFDKLYQNSTLYHRFKDGETVIPAMLDDYSFMIMALLDLFSASFEPKYLRNAIELADLCIEKFYDAENGGFYFTEDSSEHILRKKEYYDGAYYSGNSIMIGNLLKLHSLTSEARFIETAELTIAGFSGNLNQMPSAYTMFISNLFNYLKPGKELIICDEGNDSIDIINQLNLNYLPNLTIIKINEKNRSELIKIMPFIENYQQIGNKATYYLCSDFVCNAPENDAQIILDKLIGN